MMVYMLVRSFARAALANFDCEEFKYDYFIALYRVRRFFKTITNEKDKITEKEKKAIHCVTW